MKGRNGMKDFECSEMKSINISLSWIGRMTRMNEIISLNETK